MSPQLSPPTDAESRGPVLLLERDLRLLSQVVQASADGIFCQDTDGIVISWNAGAERIYGYSAAEMIGRRADDLEPPSTRERLRAAHAAVSAGQRMEHFDSWHRRREGDLIAVSVTASPLRDGSGTVVAVATSVTDISRRVELALELDLARAEVEQHNVALSRSNRELEQFAYVASHDLSEPLRVMTGYVDRLEGRYDAVLDDRGRRYMQHIVDASARMRALIDDLLKYSQFLKADHEGSMVDMAAVLAEVCASLGPTLLETGATLDFAELPPVWSDEFHLTSLLQNLLTNALKFHRPEQPPHVAFSCDIEDGWVTLHVDDNGIGIEPEYRDRVFRMFQRLHVRELYGGTGIGLAIAQKIVELNGGRIWIDDSPLGGARFSVTLPAVAPPWAVSDA